MCGFFGWFRYDRPLGEREVQRARRAVTTLSHRGPDFLGDWLEPRVFMGHQRLKIIDLSDAANQPFRSNGGILIYDGEIYNYLELRAELEKLGHRFVTNSDTE